MTDYTYEEKLQAVRREIRLREQVYPSRIATGRMSHAKAQHEIKVMRAIAEDYDKAAMKERLL